MRVKSVWQVNIRPIPPICLPPNLFTKKRGNSSNFPDTPRHFFLQDTVKKSTAKTGYTWEVWDCKRFEETICKFSMGCQSWSKWPMYFTQYNMSYVLLLWNCLFAFTYKAINQFDSKNSNFIYWKGADFVPCHDALHTGLHVKCSGHYPKRYLLSLLFCFVINCLFIIYINNQLE